ncbi:TPA: alanine--tRNA ligase, partial [Candidatus Micrarchaeota archaeon]|nr:alanine--tRNA ligase [Candidatus Micrarchaeota archaeon]
VLGRHVWQAGAHKSEEEGHIDLTHFRAITDEELKEIERLANEFIRRNIEVRTYFMKRNEAEAKFGITIYQGGAVPGRVLRIVEIPGVDVEACGGTHVKRTGDIGLLKIVKRESVADGVERIVYKAGDVALEHVQGLEDTLRRAAEVLRVGKEQVPETAEKMFNMWKEAEKRAERYMEELARLEAERIAQHVVVFEDVDEKLALKIGEFAQVRPLVLLRRSGRPNIFVFGKEAPAILRKIVEKAGGGGGGRGERAVGYVEDVDKAALIAGDILAELSSG